MHGHCNKPTFPFLTLRTASIVLPLPLLSVLKGGLPSGPPERSTIHTIMAEMQSHARFHQPFAADLSATSSRFRLGMPSLVVMRFQTALGEA